MLDAQSTRLNLRWKRSCIGTWKWPTCQPRSQCFSIPFYFLSSFTHHGTIMIYGTKTILCTIRAPYYAKTTWNSWKTKRSSVDSYYGIKCCVKLLHYHKYSMRAYFYYYCCLKYSTEITFRVTYALQASSFKVGCGACEYWLFCFHEVKEMEGVITVTVKSSNKQCVELTQDSALRNSTVCMSQNNPPQAENTHSIDRCDSTGRNRAIHDLTGVTSYWEAQ